MRHYSTRVGEHFGFGKPPTLTAMFNRTIHFSVTRLCTENPDHGLTEITPTECAYLIAVQRTRFQGQLWLDGKHVPTRPYLPEHSTIYDLRAATQAYLTTPFDCVQFYIQQSLLDLVTDELASPRIRELNVPFNAGFVDAVVANIAATLLPALSRPHEAGQIFVDHMALALAGHLAYSYGGLRPMSAPPRTGLSAWQERQAKDLLSAQLSGEFRLNEIAAACNLPTGRFVRAFRQTTGMPPHRWLRHHRVDRGKDLLLTSALSLAEIACVLGFADQSHFSRVFSNATGAPPGIWRRERRPSSLFETK